MELTLWMLSAVASFSRWPSLSLPFVSGNAGVLLPRFVLRDSLEVWPFSFGSIDFDFFAFLKNDTETF